MARQTINHHHNIVFFGSICLLVLMLGLTACGASPKSEPQGDNNPTQYNMLPSPETQTQTESPVKNDANQEKSLPSPTSQIPTLELQFDYHLHQESLQRELLSPLSIQTKDNSIEFLIIFQGGSGENEDAQLEQEGSILKVVLLNNDRKSEEMLVLYHLSGTINGVESGNYALQITDSTDRLVAEEIFNIP